MKKRWMAALLLSLTITNCMFAAAEPPILPNPVPQITNQPSGGICLPPVLPGESKPTYTPAPTNTPEAILPTPTPTPPAVMPTITPEATKKPLETATATPESTISPKPEGKPDTEETVKPTKKPTIPTVTPSAGEDYTTPSMTKQEEIAILLLNQDRVKNGLAPLEADPALCALARLKSCDMNDNQYFAHQSPTYGKASDMLKTFGYRFSAVGENIAHHASTEKAQAAFMSSSGHRKNILGSSWTKCGVGICIDKQGFVYVTQLFVK